MSKATETLEPKPFGRTNADGVGVDSADGSGEMFDAIAERYDLLNRVLSLGLDGGWRRAAVGALELPARAEVLDLATGTADLALEMARQVPGAQVVGLDPSAGMLRRGHRKVEESPVRGRIRLEQGSAESLPFERDSFDGVGMAFGIRNVTDRPAALREMARVCRPSGRVAILELSEPRGLIGFGAKFYLRSVVPWVGGMLAGSREYRYLQRSIAAFPPPDQFAEVMKECGLEVVEVRPLLFGVCHLYVSRPAVRVVAQ